jgi:nucleoside-diphosphate-sugar epimerase
MTTLVTGATGHLGANLVRALLARGETVRVFVRPESDLSGLDGLPVERAVGDLKDRRSIRTALDGIERLYHTAAFVSIRDGDRQELFDVNVVGTRHLMQEARRAGVRRVVHTSSFGAVGINPKGASNERWTVSPFELASDYERTKAVSEHDVILEALRGLDVTIVNPAAIVGPWDFRPSLVGRTILDFAHGKMRAYVPGAFDFVPMRDVVAAELLAMESGQRGERYLVTGEHRSIDEILRWLEELTGTPRPKLAIPPRLMQTVALLKDPLEKKLMPQKAPRFNYHSIRLLNSGKRGDSTRIQRELGLDPSPTRAAFAEAVDWFRNQGLI